MSGCLGHSIPAIPVFTASFVVVTGKEATESHNVTFGSSYTKVLIVVCIS